MSQTAHLNYTSDDHQEMTKRFDYLHRSYPATPRSPYTIVPRSALNYNPTERLLELSKPKIRKDNLIREGNLLLLNAFIQFLLFF